MISNPITATMNSLIARAREIVDLDEFIERHKR